MSSLKAIILLLIVTSILGCSTGNTKAKQKQIKRDREVAQLNVQLASGYIQRGNLEVAKDKLLKAIEYDDKYVPAYTTLAVLMVMLKEPQQAEEYYLQALEIDSRNPELRNNYGAFLCDIGKVEEAKEQLLIALNNQFYNTPEAAHANMGYCMMQDENPDYKQAEKHLRTALRKNERMSSALLAMGELGIKTGKYLMARAYMQRYHSLVKPSAESLWVEIQAEYALGDREHFIKLSKKLLKYFPESDEAEKVMRLSRR